MVLLVASHSQLRNLTLFFADKEEPRTNYRRELSYGGIFFLGGHERTDSPTAYLPLNGYGAKKH